MDTCVVSNTNMNWNRGFITKVTKYVECIVHLYHWRKANWKLYTKIFKAHLILFFECYGKQQFILILLFLLINNKWRTSWFLVSYIHSGTKARCNNLVCINRKRNFFMLLNFSKITVAISWFTIINCNLKDPQILAQTLIHGEWQLKIYYQNVKNFP